jgi:hypothetical protein
MLFFDRSDGRRARDRKSLNGIMPYLMRGRNESAIYFSKDLDVENAVRYVHQKNAEAGARHYSLFGLILAAAVRTVAEKPELNRFVHRRGIYERNYLSCSFIVKKELTEAAEEANAKIYFEADDTADRAMERFNAEVERARGEKPGSSEDEISAVSRIPGGKALASGLFRLLDRLNIAPPSMIRNDPLFTSVYFANLGSIGLDAPFHHLYEWGTASIFVVLGRIYQREIPRPNGAASQRHFITMRATVDERISEAIYFAHAASLFQRYLLHPELLETPLAAAGA